MPYQNPGIFNQYLFPFLIVPICFSPIIVHKVCTIPTFHAGFTSRRVLGVLGISAGVYVMSTTWIEGRRMDRERNARIVQGKAKKLGTWFASTGVGVSDPFNLADYGNRFFWMTAGGVCMPSESRCVVGGSNWPWFSAET